MLAFSKIWIQIRPDFSQSWSGSELPAKVTMLTYKEVLKGHANVKRSFSSDQNLRLSFWSWFKHHLTTMACILSHRGNEMGLKPLSQENYLQGLLSCWAKFSLLSYRDWESSGSVVACLTWDRGVAGSSLSGVTALCPWARQVNPCLVLAQYYKTHLDIQCSWKDVDWDIWIKPKKKQKLQTLTSHLVQNVGPPSAHQWYAISMAYCLWAVGGLTLSQWLIAGGPLVAWRCALAGYSIEILHVTLVSILPRG